jgi:predicted transcriptional regulator
MEKKQVNPTSIRFKEELLIKLEEEAKKEKRSLTKHIEYIIEQYYELKKLLNK